jgi:DNA-binding response OmpR family regulator
MRQGADEYLVKPCTEDELLRAANKLIKSCSPIDISTGALPQTKAGAASEKPAENAAQEPADKPKIKSLKDKMQESFYRFND